MKNGEPKGLDHRPYRVIHISGMRFPEHIHRTYEVMRVTRGTARTTIDGVTYTVPCGSSVVVFPLQYHGFEVDGGSRITIHIFAPELIPEFDARLRSFLPENPVVDIPEDCYAAPADDDLFRAKSFFYRLCGEILDRLPLREGRVSREPTVIDNIFLYVDRNYRSDCSLRAVAEALCYDYTYLSKGFKHQTGVSYTEYLNRFRVNKACYLLATGEAQVTEVADAVGFNSLRTFDREFVKIIGMTPRAYQLQANIAAGKDLP